LILLLETQHCARNVCAKVCTCKFLATHFENAV
jgi:hypothetical protein